MHFLGLSLIFSTVLLRISLLHKGFSRSCTPTTHNYTLLGTPRIDTCNILLYRLPQYILNQQLQKIQHTSARLVHRTPCRKSVSPLLQQLHWIPVHFRILFKILLFTCKARNNARPSFISSLIITHIPPALSDRQANIAFMSQ